jgi:hypothetical protein
LPIFTAGYVSGQVFYPEQERLNRDAKIRRPNGSWGKSNEG